MAVHAGRYFSAALSSDGTVTVWGDGVDGQKEVPAINATDLAAGGYHLLAISDGEVVAWGADDDGQIQVPEPPAGTTVTAISAGMFHSVALFEAGDEPTPQPTPTSSPSTGQPGEPVPSDSATQPTAVPHPSDPGDDPATGRPGLPSTGAIGGLAGAAGLVLVGIGLLVRRARKRA